jgi:hypothetical protein
MDTKKAHLNRLLTTRLRASVAVGLTAFVFVFSIRDVLHPQQARGWLLPLDFLLHGWALTGVNIAFYCYLCWLAFWFIRGTHGRERVVMVGWFVTILLAPFESVWRQWAMAMRYVEALALLVALLASVAILLDSKAVAESSGRPV